MENTCPNPKTTIYALVGKSGTGKSHRAIKLAHKYNIEIIIDDGLIIKNNQILAGKTAKRQPTRIGAIKTALFIDEKEANEARKALLEASPKSILILGTSKGMTDKIATALNLGIINHYINIEDISSPKEIENAKIMRTQHARHVIPAPTVEVKKSFPETWVDPLKIILRPHPKNEQQNKTWQEQSIVRPTFTSYGNLSISHSALVSIVTISTKNIREVKHVGKIQIDKKESVVKINLAPTIYYTPDLPIIASKIQKKVHYMVEYMTGLLVKEVNVIIKDLYLPPKEKNK